MLIAHEADRRCIALAEDDVAGQPETRFAPGGDEAVGLVPAVEADAKTVVLEQAEDFREGWLEPAVVIVVNHGPPVARTVAGDIRRIGQHEIDAGGIQPAHQCRAVAQHDRIE